MDEIAGAVDTLDNLIAALSLPMLDAIHVQALRAKLPEVRDAVKRGYLSAGGEEVWAN
ncbi:hypothetical protein J2794_003590 [Paraburkholderia terricola]|uniref:hypothetical protein n=1 Tax=Paraburkholderia terricola TaxID=169427 RepID=UPI002865CCBA|nr:hypothetical protein [Paraburkholderia terricola]MDR6447474.1 hypothetical protein [Paraburkholderia terricola]